MESSRISYYLDPTRYPQEGDATYVQLIHANYDNEKRLFRMGTTRNTNGGVDIFVDGLPRGREHVYCLYIHMATAIKKAVLTAHANGSINQGSEHYQRTQDQLTLAPDEIFVGIWGRRDDKKLGVFRITLADEGQRLNATIKHLRPVKENVRFKNRK